VVKTVKHFNSLISGLKSDSGAAVLDKMVLCFGMVLFGALVSGSIADRQADITRKLTAQMSAQGSK
jgi:hypothetical protein